VTAPPSTAGPPEEPPEEQPDPSSPRGTPRIHQLRARYARRVTPDHVGQRVSIRHLVAHPERGTVPSDVVGRLVGADPEAMLVVDRAGQLTVIDTHEILSSRVVPPHPKLEPEPEVGTRESPLERTAARALVLDPDERVLLVAHAPEPTRRVWTAPGGGLRPGESHEQAVVRELAEEIGITVDTPGPWVWSRRVTFRFRGCWLDQDERWHLVRLEAPVEVTDAPLDDPGAVEVRWWRVPELRQTTAELAPASLADHLTRLLADGPPAAPVDVGR
jgi:ADP-ribose pyrophosphatase YjhB (NUDIX family)